MMCTILLAATLLGSQGKETSAAGAVGTKVEAFTLRDYRGAERSLDEFNSAKAVVVAFLGTECPLVKLYAPKLAALAHEYEPQGVVFLAVNANVQDSVTEIDHFARAHKIEFPILKDVGNVLADRMGAERTPEVFLLDGARVIRYRGRIDDQYGVGYQRPKPQVEDLTLALDELLGNKPISRSRTEVVGCSIGRVRAPDIQSPVTYSKQIARILQNRCIECHRAGQIGPFALTSYAEAAGWAEMIREVVEENRMPPWHADPEYGAFLNDARLSDDEKRLIVEWAKAGAPEGNPADLPKPREFIEGWRIPKPDAVFQLSQEVTVPARGTIAYRYYVIDPGFTEDKWVQFAEARPDNRQVVHHIIVFVKPPGARDDFGQDEVDSNWLTATAPGARPLILPDGMAKFIPKGSTLIFQMHYTANGSEQKDRSSVGMVFADPKTVRKQVATKQVSVGPRLRIPPNAPNHRVEASRRLNDDTLLLAMFPHMHLRGKSFRYEAVYPDGKSEILLDVPRYDFNWQNGYVCKEPKLLPRGTTLRCIAHFDNSENNLSNPDPNVTVRWGDQTWDEMMIGYYDMALADQDLLAPSRAERFASAASSGALALSDDLKAKLRDATRSNDAFTQAGRELRQLVPQADRMDLITVSEDRLRVEFAVNAHRRAGRVPGPGYEREAANLTLARHARDGKIVTHDSLADATGLDFVLLKMVFASSVHLPITYGGKPGLVSFYSRERSAFPPAAVELLQSASKLIADGSADRTARSAGSK